MSVVRIGNQVAAVATSVLVRAATFGAVLLARTLGGCVTHSFYGLAIWIPITFAGASVCRCPISDDMAATKWSKLAFGPAVFPESSDRYRNQVLKLATRG